MKKTVILGVTGSIAAYKSCEITRALVKKDINVFVVMTEHAREFITPLTMRTLSGNPVFIDMFSENTDFSMPHINLSKMANTLIIAPASGNIIGKIANGIGDDLLSTLALSFKGMILIAPAMNTAMYENPVMQENLQKLKKLKNIRIIEPEKGDLACGDKGRGRLADIKTIVNAVLKNV